jgi:predicted transcriptional regulator of viral defense system
MAGAPVNMPGARYTQLAARAAANLGYVTTDDARDLSIAIGTINAMARRGQIERVCHGVYRMPVIPPGHLDAYKLATLWPDRRGLISHSSALELRGIRDLDPARIHVTVPTSYRTHRAVPGPYALRHQDVAPADRECIDGVPVVSLALAVSQVEADELTSGASQPQDLALP